MKVGIHKAYHNKFDKELEIYKTILRYNNIEYIELNSSDKNFWSDLAKIDVFLYKWGHEHNSRQIALSILPIIENYKKIRCFPNLATSWLYDDKVRESLILKECGFPAADFFIFWEKSEALEWLNSWDEFPIVFKLKNGAGATNVNLVNSRRKCKSIILRMFGRGMIQDNISILERMNMLNYDFRKIYRHYGIRLRSKFIHEDSNQFWQKHKNYIYFQRFLPGNSYDTRVTTAGLRAHAFRRFVRPNDFRASGSNLWDIDPANIDLRMIQIALDITKYFGFQSMAYDFVYDKNHEPKIIEMSYLYGGAGFPDFMNGYWDENLSRHEGRFWPQHFELMDLLQDKSLKCPEMEATGSYTKAKIV